MRLTPCVRERLCAAIVFAFAGGALAGCGGGGSSSLPQVSQPSNPSNPAPSSNVVNINVTQSMQNALPTFNNFKYHIMRVRSSVSRHPQGVAFPLDMANHGGHVLPTATQHEIFLNTTAAAVGNPQTFQANFSNSTFIHVLDQYAGVATNNRYPVSATLFSVTISAFTNLISENQVLTAVHAAVAASHLSGYTHEYNIFLKSGLDTCIDFDTCYSPDNPSTFGFCAYHGSVTFSDVGHVLFAVIPFQHTPGCGDDFPGFTLPNAVPIDDTATAISHEESETISDPDATAFFNDAFGFEIGDACEAFRANESLNAHTYLIQPEYSNTAHGCFF